MSVRSTQEILSLSSGSTSQVRSSQEVLLVSFQYHAMTAAVIAETQVDAYPNASISNVFIRFRLRGFTGSVPVSNGSIVTVTATMDAGAISQPLIPNNAIFPSTTFYTIELWSNGRITSSRNAVINGNVDLSTLPQ